MWRGVKIKKKKTEEVIKKEQKFIANFYFLITCHQINCLEFQIFIL